MVRKIVIPLIVMTLLSCSFLACEGPRGPLCNPFRPSVENHIWFWWPEGIAGFEFDDNGNLLYIVDGVPAQFGELASSSIQPEFQKLPLSGEFTNWYPVKKGGLGGFWIKHYAVKPLIQPWGVIYPGVDYEYYLAGGTRITECKREDFRYYTDEPFDPPLQNYVWKIVNNELFGIEFDRKGSIRYLVHGVPGTYSLNDVPISGEYTVWYPIAPKSKEGYWLKHTAVKEFRMLWGKVSPGVDLNFSSFYSVRDLTKRNSTGYTDEPFSPQVRNHVWKEENNHLYGFEFDERGRLLYIIDGIPGKYSLDDVPYSEEYTVWRPLTVTSQQGYWLRYTAVKKAEKFWGEVIPGVDYSYLGGKSIKDIPQSSEFTSKPFPGLEDCIWKKKANDLYGAQFDKNGTLLYLMHGIPGTYSLNDVPLSGEYVTWVPIEEGIEEGFWVKHVAVSECEMKWGSVTYGVDLNYTAEGSSHISGLTRDHYMEGWDVRKILKYLWDLFMNS